MHGAASVDAPQILQRRQYGAQLRPIGIPFAHQFQAGEPCGCRQDVRQVSRHASNFCMFNLKGVTQSRLISVVEAQSGQLGQDSRCTTAGPLHICAVALLPVADGNTV